MKHERLPAALPTSTAEQPNDATEQSRIPPRYRQVCALMRAWGMPDDLARLGLVMRRVERGSLALADLDPAFGGPARAAAAALAAFGHAPRPALQHAERAWQLFMLACLEPAAGVLKIAELLAQLRGAQDADIDVPAETIAAGAHAAVRLGMWDVRTELLNARVSLSDPRLARRARTFLDQSQPARVGFFDVLREELAALLHAHGIAAIIERRSRPIHQVVEDGLESARGAFPWADVVVLLIEDRQDRYRALGAINSAYSVVGSKVRDYIGGPKENGYQAIHTTVLYTAARAGDRTAPVELHITTSTMDRYNCGGYLAHLAGGAPPGSTPLWLTDRRRWRAAEQGRSAELFVFTPQAETVFLPRGATVLDFAVRVHLDLGAYCQDALVNGYRTSPGTKLECGDICEVLIDPRGEQIDQRLLDRAHTTAAKAGIRRALSKDRPAAKHGQEIFRAVLAKRLEEQEIRSSRSTVDQHVATICRGRGYQTIESFYRAVARGEAAPDQLASAVVELLLLPRLDLDALPAELRASARTTRLAQCCRPRPSLPAAAITIHGGHQIKIHAAGCASLPSSAYRVAWKPAEEQAYVADVVYESWDRPGLIRQVIEVIEQAGAINIRSFSADVPEPRLARLRFSFESRSQAQVEQVRQALDHLPERRYVDLRTLTLIDDGGRIDAPLDNPYGPHPVGRWPLFVGRDIQVREVVAQLSGHSGAKHILIHGPKRIGKSSLLQHLSRYHLSSFTVPALVDLQGLATDDLYFPQLLGHLSELIVQKAGPRARAARLEAAAIMRDPIRAFGRFLGDIRANNDVDRFVILIDELGVVLSRLRDSGRTSEFFDQWRALLNDENVYSHLAFIVAMPDSSLPELREQMQAPLRAGELGYPIRLSVLDERDARDLISAPVLSHLAYQPADMDRLVRETGGHPYYIHLVCGQIITAVQARQRKIGAPAASRQEIDSAIVQAGLDAVFRANQDAFYHTLADNAPSTSAVLRALAALTNDDAPLVRRAQLRGMDATLDDGAIARAIEERPDLLVMHDDGIGIRVALVARWLRWHT